MREFLPQSGQKKKDGLILAEQCGQMRNSAVVASAVG
jgi:hypothetical protein